MLHHQKKDPKKKNQEKTMLHQKISPSRRSSGNSDKEELNDVVTNINNVLSHHEVCGLSWLLSISVFIKLPHVHTFF